LGLRARLWVWWTGLESAGLINAVKQQTGLLSARLWIRPTQNKLQAGQAGWEEGNKGAEEVLRPVASSWGCWLRRGEGWMDGSPLRRRGVEDRVARARYWYASVPITARCRPARPGGCCLSVSSQEGSGRRQDKTRDTPSCRFGVPSTPPPPGLWASQQLGSPFSRRTTTGYRSSAAPNAEHFGSAA